MKKYIAELIGTFSLALAVSVALTNNLLLAPVAAGLTLALFVYTIGHVSGSHINPAVTLGFLFMKKIDIKDALGYIAAQFLGAFLAVMIFGQFSSEAINLVSPDSLKVGIAEMIGSFLFTFGIAAAVHERTPSAVKGLVIGGSLPLGIVIASIGSNGILNPAVAYALGSFSWAYALGPILGAVLGMWFFSFTDRANH